jgi:hypothetical protein
LLQENYGDYGFKLSGEDRPVHTANTTAALLQDLLDDRNVSVQIDHYGLQTLRPLISFCGDFFKKSAQRLTKKPGRQQVNRYRS